MLGPFLKELAEIRAETLRNDWGPRSRRSPRARGHIRRAIGLRVVAIGERLAGECREAPTIRIGGDA